MSAREIQDQKAVARQMFVQQAAHANADVSASPQRGPSNRWVHWLAGLSTRRRRPSWRKVQQPVEADRWTARAWWSASAAICLFTSTTAQNRYANSSH